jgi:tRNA dimethylallyltransferase
VLDEIRGKGRPAIVVGGTGLYFRALTEGLAEIPPAPPEARQAAEGLLDSLGEAGFRARLAQIDPEAATRIAPGDRQRLVRAMEVYTASGRSLSAWQARTQPVLAPEAWRAVVLEPPRALLYARCDARLRTMIDEGALDEARRLIGRGLDPAAPVMKAVGVRELAQHLSGAITLEAALAQAQQQTRRYAKRQSTWLRNQAPSWPRLHGETDMQAFLEHSGRA